MVSVGKVRTVASGVPALFRVGRDELGTTGAAALVGVSGLALTAAVARAPHRPKLQNAIRHFAWSAYLAARHDPAVAERITIAHEAYSVDALDSEVDTRNNAVGRRYGAEHRAEIAARSAPAAIWALAGIGVERWRQGALWVARGGEVVSSPGRRPRLSRGRG